MPITTQLISTDYAVVEAWNIINKVAVEIDFPCIPAIYESERGEKGAYSEKGAHKIFE